MYRRCAMHTLVIVTAFCGLTACDQQSPPIAGVHIGMDRDRAVAALREAGFQEASNPSGTSFSVGVDRIFAARGYMPAQIAVGQHDCRSAQLGSTHAGGLHGADACLQEMNNPDQPAGAECISIGYGGDPNNPRTVGQIIHVRVEEPGRGKVVAAAPEACARGLLGPNR